MSKNMLQDLQNRQIANIQAIQNVNEMIYLGSHLNKDGNNVHRNQQMNSAEEKRDYKAQ